MANLSADQVNELVEAAMGADGGCIHCVGPILGSLRNVFPDVDWERAVRRCQKKWSLTYSAKEYIEAMNG